MSAVCRGTAGPGGPTPGGAARPASGAVGAAGTDVAGTHAAGADVGGTDAAGAEVEGTDAEGSGAATGASPPTRTCDHGTDRPRNGGAADGGRGAVYGSEVHVVCTSSGRWAESRGSGCRSGTG